MVNTALKSFGSDAHQTHPRSNPVSAIVFILIVVVIAIALLISTDVNAGVQADGSADVHTGAVVSHATLKHGFDAALARQCLNKDQQYFLFHNPSTNRYGTVCQIDGIWGIVITNSAGREITSFVKNKMTRFEQVLQYMKNAGYELIH